jgi:DNA adenine methylase
MSLPFLKWPGGKRWAAPIIARLLAESLTGTYYEPFLGGGAVFFHLQPKKAVLSDINPDLIETYVAVQRNPDGVLERLQRLRVSKREYYRIRSEVPNGELLRAARFLYLNRTAFGGIYRLNHEGEFNVPYGGGKRTPNILWKNELITKSSESLVGTKILCRNYETILSDAGQGDAVYCDPTYTVTHDRNCFVRYNEMNFAWADQQRLALAVARAVERGATVVVSNAHHPAVLDLYPNAEVRTLSRTSCVSRDPNKRRSVEEYLFVLRPTASSGNRLRERVAGVGSLRGSSRA